MSEDLYGKKIFPKNEGFGLTSQMIREALTLEPLNPRSLESFSSTNREKNLYA